MCALWPRTCTRRDIRFVPNTSVFGKMSALLNSALWFYTINSGSQMYLPTLLSLYTKFNRVNRIQRDGTWQVLHQWSHFQFTHPFHHDSSSSKASPKDLHFGTFSHPLCPIYNDWFYLTVPDLYLFPFLLWHWWNNLINGYAKELLGAWCLIIFL